MVAQSVRASERNSVVLGSNPTQADFLQLLLKIICLTQSDLFNVTLQITGYVSLHNQMPLHITQSMLVFTSHCLCFYYKVICPVYQNTPSVSFRLHDPDAFASNFEQAIILVISFSAFFANGIKICFTPAAHVPLVLSCLRNPSVLAADFDRSLFRLFVPYLVC